ncbi:MAG: DUF2652 domain-containing protein [Chloroflexi bacterium]|nr:DUF2652 domain-containing protein [Chloroflexota bacterium]
MLELIVGQMKPLLTIAEIEGDAVYAYAPESKVQRGETLLELCESTYLAFRDRVESVRRRTTCQCNACKSIPNLDLKFVVHYGEYLLQSVSGITKLVGSDINLVHRLLKNHVSEATGWKAYALFSDAALTQMKVKPEGLHEETEHYEHLGEVKTHSLNLHARYKELMDLRRVFISPEDADLIMSFLIPASPITIWGWMNEPEKRLQWETFDDIRPLIRPGGRTGAGARNHCAHGKNVVAETILDWRPFEYYTVEFPMAVQSRCLETEPDRTRLDIKIKLKMPLPQRLTRPLAQFMFKQFKAARQFETMVRLIAEQAVGDESKV